jgi:hypothetical protein
VEIGGAKTFSDLLTRNFRQTRAKWQMVDVANITKNWLDTVTLSLFGAN